MVYGQTSNLFTFNVDVCQMIRQKCVNRQIDLLFFFGAPHRSRSTISHCRISTMFTLRSFQVASEALCHIAVLALPFESRVASESIAAAATLPV